MKIKKNILKSNLFITSMYKSERRSKCFCICLDATYFGMSRF